MKSNTVIPTLPAEEYAAFIGLDWADQKHQISLRAAGAQTTERRQVEHQPTALHTWVSQLRQRFPAGKIAIALEQGRGGLIHALLGYDFVVLFLLNPKAVARFRESLHVSGAKSDPCDADCQLEMLLTRRHLLQPWRPEDADTRLLALLVEHRREWVDQRTALVLALQSALKAYYPLALSLVGRELEVKLATDFLAKWPTLESLQGAKTETIRRFFLARNCRHQVFLQERLSQVEKAQALTTDRAVIAAYSLKVTTLVKMLVAVRGSIEQYDERIAHLFERHPEAPLYQSLPGAGQIMEPRLLVAFGTDRDRFQDADAMARFSGTAPITETSGKMRKVRRRYARPVFVHQTFVEYAKCTLNYSPWALCYYRHQYAHGHGHNAALRKLAIRWQRIIWRCWEEGTRYDEAKYLQSILKKSPEIYAKLAVPPAVPTSKNNQKN